MNKTDFNIRLEEKKDYRIVEEITREAFWNLHAPGLNGNEDYYAHILREHEDFIPELDFVIETDGKIIGNVMYSKAWLVDENGTRKTILSFGPLSIHPDYQRQGFSRVLLEHSFEKARELGYDVIVIFGHPCNYISRGFMSCKRFNICLEGDIFPCALLVKELVPNALDGRKWIYEESSAVELACDNEAAEKFDSTFPPKEKLWQPSQEEFYIYSHSAVVF